LNFNSAALLAKEKERKSKKRNKEKILCLPPLSFNVCQFSDFAEAGWIEDCHLSQHLTIQLNTFLRLPINWL